MSVYVRQRSTNRLMSIGDDFTFWGWTREERYATRIGDELHALMIIDIIGIDRASIELVYR